MENKSRENDIRATAFAIFVGIIFICAGVFIFLTLIGFNPKDSLFFSTQLNSEVDHFLGKTGSIISSFLFYYTGRGAFVLAYFLIFSGLLGIYSFTDLLFEFDFNTSQYFTYFSSICFAKLNQYWLEDQYHLSAMAGIGKNSRWRVIKSLRFCSFLLLSQILSNKEWLPEAISCLWSWSQRLVTKGCGFLKCFLPVFL